MTALVGSPKTMKLSRPSRAIAAVIVLFSMLFMQLAVAAYACPELRVGPQAGTMAAPSAQMPPCHQKDPAQPSLCHAFGQSGNQSLDKPTVPPLQPFVAVGFGLPVSPLELSYPPAFNPPEKTAFLRRATAPPLAIRHCCFRI